MTINFEKIKFQLQEVNSFLDSDASSEDAQRAHPTSLRMKEIITSMVTQANSKEVDSLKQSTEQLFCNFDNFIFEHRDNLAPLLSSTEFKTLLSVGRILNTNLLQKMVSTYIRMANKGLSMAQLISFVDCVPEIIGYRDNLGNNLLHLLFLSNCPIESVKVVIKRGLSATSVNKKGETPFHLLSEMSENYTFKCLVGSGLLLSPEDCLIKDKKGNTLLHLAVLHKNKILLEQVLFVPPRCRVNLSNCFHTKNKEKQTPVDIAFDLYLKDGDTSICKYFIDRPKEFADAKKFASAVVNNIIKFNAWALVPLSSGHLPNADRDKLISGMKKALSSPQCAKVITEVLTSNTTLLYNGEFDSLVPSFVKLKNYEALKAYVKFGRGYIYTGKRRDFFSQFSLYNVFLESKDQIMIEMLDWSRYIIPSGKISEKEEFKALSYVSQTNITNQKEAFSFLIKLFIELKAWNSFKKLLISPLLESSRWYEDNAKKDLQTHLEKTQNHSLIAFIDEAAQAAQTGTYPASIVIELLDEVYNKALEKDDVSFFSKVKENSKIVKACKEKGYFIPNCTYRGDFLDFKDYRQNDAMRNSPWQLDCTAFASVFGTVLALKWSLNELTLDELVWSLKEIKRVNQDFKQCFKSFLESALINGYKETVLPIIELMEEDIPEKINKTPLMCRLIRLEDKELIEKIERRGVRLDVQDHLGHSPVYYALENDDSAMALFLIEKGVTLRLIDVLDQVVSTNDFESKVCSSLKRRLTASEKTTIEFLQLFQEILPSLKWSDRKRSLQELVTPNESFLQFISSAIEVRETIVPNVQYESEVYKDLYDLFDRYKQEILSKEEKNGVFFKDIQDVEDHKITAQGLEDNFKHWVQLVETKGEKTGVTQDKKEEIYGSIERVFKHLLNSVEPGKPLNENCQSALLSIARIDKGYCIDPFKKTVQWIYNQVKTGGGSIVSMDPVIQLREKVYSLWTESRDLALQHIYTSGNSTLDTHAHNWILHYFGKEIGVHYQKDDDKYIDSEGLFHLSRFLGVEQEEEKLKAELRHTFWNFFIINSFSRFNSFIQNEVQNNSDPIPDYYRGLIDSKSDIALQQVKSQSKDADAKKINEAAEKEKAALNEEYLDVDMDKEKAYLKPRGVYEFYKLIIFYERTKS